MTDRLTEIRARLDALAGTVTGTNERMVWDSDRAYHMEDDRDRASQAFHRHAPADIAWLLAELTLRDEDVEDIYDLRDQVNAAMDTIYHLTGPGDALIAATDYYAERVKVQRETRRPHE